jgi:acyl-coenzyme A thioesterase PaaI-like protein
MSTPGDLHPGIAGRPDEMAALADTVRRLIVATVANRAPGPVVAEAARSLAEVAATLEAHVPDPPPQITALSAEAMGGEGGSMADRMAFDVVIGPWTPLALPIEISFEPPLALGHARFTLPYEGPPGCVHGATIAGAFDVVLTAANVLEGVAGPTVSLTSRYRRPTRLHVESRFEAWVEDTDGRRTLTRGRLVQEGETTVESEGVFAVMTPERIAALRSATGGSGT